MDEFVNGLKEEVAELEKILEESPKETKIPDIFDLDLDTLEKEIKGKESAIAGYYKTFGDKLDNTKNTVGSYNLDKYFTGELESKVNSIAGQVSTELGKAQTAFGTLQSDQIKTIGDTYTQYNKYVSDLRDSVYKSYDNALSQTDMVKDVFVQTGKLTADENRRLIGDFAEMMPNSRSGESINEAVAEFVTSPIDFTSVDTRTAVAATRESDNSRLIIIFYICIAAVVVSALVRAFKSSRAKRKEYDAR
jgi:polyhydroxyalkanoate synthesis regulator phasin